MAITLERADEADIQLLIGLEKTVSGTNIYSPMLEEAEWKEEFDQGNDIFLIKKDGVPVGNVSYERKSPDHIYISGLMVAPEFQGKGIARYVLQQILDQYSNVNRIDLVTHPDNPARSLYESLGFAVEERKENYWGDGEPRLVLALVK